MVRSRQTTALGNGVARRREKHSGFSDQQYDTVAVVIVTVRQSHSITDDRDDYRAMAGSESAWGVGSGG